MSVHALTVWWGKDGVGTLSIDEHGDIGFVYLPAWLTRAGAWAIS